MRCEHEWLSRAGPVLADVPTERLRQMALDLDMTARHARQNLQRVRREIERRERREGG